MTIPTLSEINRVIDQVRNGRVTYDIVKRPGENPRTYTQLPQPTIAEMMVTSMLTGMRINEVCGLIVADLDLDAGIICLTQQLNAHTRERGPLKTALVGEISPWRSSLITAGRPIHEVSVVMGHSSAAMTLNVYTQVLDRSGAGMRDAIGSAIGCRISGGSRHLRAVPETGS